MSEFIFYCMNITPFLTHSLVEGYLGLFLLFQIVKEMSIDRHLHLGLGVDMCITLLDEFLGMS